jgi:hypothetical protein
MLPELERDGLRGRDGEDRAVDGDDLHDVSPGLSQRISHRVKAAAPPGRPPYNGFAMPERTMLDKVWARHVVAIGSGGRTLRLMEGRGQ